MEIKLICGDFKEVQKEIDDNSVDLIFTDPPYPKQYIHCFQNLADYSPRIMKHGASLVTIVGHYQLELVMDMFRGKLKYRWILCLNQFKRNHARMAMGIEVMWKPMLWYVKDSYPHGRGFLMDGIEINTSEGIKKDLHKWQQPEDWCIYYIQKLTKEGDTVLDPYMGSGTVGLVCKKINRNFIGIDIDENSVISANNRINNGIIT